MTRIKYLHSKIYIYTGIYIFYEGVITAGSTQRYYIAGGSEEEERQENKEK